jgi:molybdopterin/thiamine biosynthesis adenylyltransferase
MWALVLMLLATIDTLAQNPVEVRVADTVFVARADSLLAADSMLIAKTDSLIGRSIVVADSVQMADKTRQPRNWDAWRPDPKRAMWLALVIPGGGQIYNRKYWKLPIVYGGFIGCVYALSWNNMMYKDYQQAYRDIMDDDPNTASYNKFLHLGRQINSTNVERYKQIFKTRKDKYRRWRDLSFFVMVGVYAVSVIDAYVDAELSDFDISKDLSMKVRPAVFGSGISRNPLYATSLGVNCSLNF